MFTYNIVPIYYIGISFEKQSLFTFAERFLPFYNKSILVVLHGDVDAVPAFRAAPVIEEGELERKGAVKVVEAGAPPVKDGRLNIATSTSSKYVFVLQ